MLNRMRLLYVPRYFTTALLPSTSARTSRSTAAAAHELLCPIPPRQLSLSLTPSTQVWITAYMSRIAGSWASWLKSGIPPPFCICSAIWRILGFCINRSRPPLAIICCALSRVSAMLHYHV